MVNAALGQEQGSVSSASPYHCHCLLLLLCFRKLKIFVLLLKREHLKIAQQYFQLVGGSASECGTFCSFLCILQDRGYMYATVAVVYFLKSASSLR